MFNQNLNPGRTVIFTATPTSDAENDPGALMPGAVPTWSVPAPASGVSIVPAADGMSASVTAAATAPPGVTDFTINGQLASGYSVATEFTVTIPDQPATGFEITAGTPTP
jgi:hypothetical protein